MTSPAKVSSSLRPSAARITRILIVDDHPLIRRGMVALLAQQKDFEICGESDCAKNGLTAMREHHPDVVLVDIRMPGTDGLELIKLMLAEQPKLLILVVSMHDESVYALRALRAGAKGYLMKSEAIEQVVAAVRKLLAGGIYVTPRFSERLVFRAIHSLDNGMGSPVDRLSDRELEVLRFLGRGVGTRDMAKSLHLSVKTIETHRAHIKEKLGFKDTAEMVGFAIDWTAQEEGGPNGQPSLKS